MLPRDLKVDLLKIDIEGADYQALIGAKDIFERSPPPVVIIEITSHFKEISEFLAQYEYRFFYFAAGTLVPIGRGQRDLNLYAIREALLAERLIALTE
jgi:hypothetical protein